MDRLTPDQYLQRLGRLKEIASTAQEAGRLCQTLYFMPEGHADIINAFRRLDRLLFTQSMPWEERVGDAEGPRRRVYHTSTMEITGSPVWQLISSTLLALMRHHDRILADHAWGPMIAESRGPLPEVPAPMSPSVQSLMDTATALKEWVAEAKSKFQASAATASGQPASESSRDSSADVENPPLAPQVTDTIPYTSPLCASDLARLLREKLSLAVTDDAVESWLRRFREKRLDCYEKRDRDDRRRNEPQYVYRPEVWTALVEHFAPATDGA